MTGATESPLPLAGGRTGIARERDRLNPLRPGDDGGQERDQQWSRDFRNEPSSEFHNCAVLFK